jgi:hypothetical protein
MADPTNISLVVVQVVGSGVFAGFVAAIASYFFTRSREREARAHADAIAKQERLRGFEGFLVEKEQIAEATPTEDVHNLYFRQDGLLNAGLFRKEAAKVRRDFPPSMRAEFNRLDDALGRISPDALKADGSRTSREKLADAIRAILTFARGA